MTRLLRAGAAAGAAGGVAFAAVLLLLGEGPLGRAIALEETGGHEAGAAPFGRGAQQFGGALGSVVLGVAVGVVLAVVLGAVRHRMRARSDRARAYMLVASGFAAVTLVPFLLYPPNPPGVGDPGTIGTRTGAYLLAVAWSVVSLAAAGRFHRWLVGRGREAAALPGAVALFVALVGFAAAVLPERTHAAGVPAELVWDFRVASLLGGAALWGVLGAVFGRLAPKALDG